MIFGTGTDIVAVDRLAQGLGRYQERYARRILGEHEFEEFRALRDRVGGRAGGTRGDSGAAAIRIQAHFLAKRFAAKEAVAKALGIGFRRGLNLSDIEVLHDELGKPLVRYSAKGRRLVDGLGAGACQLSISDERDYAIAFVVIESAPGFAE